MKTLKQMIKRLKIEIKNWNRVSKEHANSKISKLNGYVTKDEHITGEKLSFIEGWNHALEWVINDDELLDKEFI